MSSLFFISGFLLLWSSSHALECTNPTALQEEQQKCFSQLGLSVGSGTEGFEYAVQNDPSSVCSQPEKYKQALSCAFSITKTCLQQTGISSDVLPDENKLGEGITYMCQHYSEIDQQCVTNSQSALQQCVMSRAASIVSQVNPSDISAVICAGYKLAYVCMKESLDHCPMKTAEVILKYMNDYFRPPACSSFDEGGDSDDDNNNSGPDSDEQPRVLCGNVTSMMSEQLYCYEREGILIQLPQPDGTNPQSSQQALDMLTKSYESAQEICRNKAQYKRALECQMEVSAECVPDGFKGFLPDSDNLGDIVDYMCEDIDKIKFTCMASKMNEMTQCIANKGRQLAESSDSTNDIGNAFCSAYQLSLECLTDALPACGCPTTRMYSRVIKAMYPPRCPAPNSPTPTCDAATGEFLSGGPSNDGVRPGKGPTDFVFTVIIMISLLAVV